MRLVDDDGEVALPVVVGDLFQNIRESLNGGDDDALAAGQEVPQLARLAVALSRNGTDGRTDLGKLADRAPYLLIQDGAVGDDDDGIEDRLFVALAVDELADQPGDGVRLAAARRVLNQIPPTSAVGTDIAQQLMHHIHLVVTREDHLFLLPPGLLVLFLNLLREMLDDIGQTPRACTSKACKQLQTPEHLLMQTQARNWL